MQATTARRIREARTLLGRDFFPKERARILSRAQAGQPLLDVYKNQAGGRPGVTLVWPDRREFLSISRTGVRLATAARSAVLSARPKVTPVAASSNGARAQAAPRERRDRRTASPSRAGPDDGSDSDEAEPALDRRLCENPECTRGPDGGPADITHRRAGSHSCCNACKTESSRLRSQAKEEAKQRAHLDRRAGTTTWKVSCNHPRAHGQFAPEGVCFACGRPRGEVTLGWETDGPKGHRSYVDAPTPRRKNPRLGDGSRKLSFTDEHGRPRTLPAPPREEVAAA